jgi:hypothetical protein
VDLIQTVPAKKGSDHFPFRQEASMAFGPESSVPQPPRKIVKNLVARTMMFALGRGFQAASSLDEDVRREISVWPDGFTVTMKVMPRGPSLTWVKEAGRMRSLGGREQPANLTIMFKNLEAALLVLTARMGNPQAFAEHRLSVKGSLADAMILTRCLNITQAYLFPRLISGRIMKRAPRIPLGRLLKNRAIIYTAGVPFGRP